MPFLARLINWRDYFKAHPKGEPLPPMKPPAVSVTDSNVRVIDLPWGPPASGNVTIDTRQLGGFHNETIAVRFTTPNQTAPGYAKISCIESNAAYAVQRIACLSETPGDLDHPIAYSRAAGIGASFVYGVGTDSPRNANLKPGTTYYFNVKNVDMHGNPTCPAGVSCDIFVELAKPTGL